MGLIKIVVDFMSKFMQWDQMNFLDPCTRLTKYNCIKATHSKKFCPLALNLTVLNINLNFNNLEILLYSCKLETKSYLSFKA